MQTLPHLVDCVLGRPSRLATSLGHKSKERKAKFWTATLAFAYHVLAGSASLVAGEPVFPGVDWERNTNGLAPETFREVDTFVHTLDATGLMVVQNGRVIYEYGNVKRLSYLASARKSVLSMLYGPYVASGKIRLDASIKDLGISDAGGLLAIEERATVADLIAARSGVYRQGTSGFGLLYELKFSIRPGITLPTVAGDPLRPKRGSKQPGTYWYYNNWDFNTAGAIFEKMTGKDIYDALRDDLAIPIGMQDFNRQRQQKSGDMTRSIYPAYHIVLSTRDMARLGLLMLREGKWRDRQLIPAEWVRRSTTVKTPLAEIKESADLGYAYMWWVWEDTTGPSKGAYTAMGSYGQYITILPALDMVVSLKTCPDGSVGLVKYFRLLALLSGKEPATSTELASWLQQRPKTSPPKERVAIKLDQKIYDAYVGQYIMAADPEIPGTVTLTIKRSGDGLVRQVPGWFAQQIFPQSETVFFNTTEDEQLTFIKNNSGEVTGLSLSENGFGEVGQRKFKRLR